MLIPAGTLVRIWGKTTMTAPPGAWISLLYQGESPHGRTTSEAFGRLSVPADSEDPRWRSQRPTVVDVVPSGWHAPLCQIVAGPEWGTLAPCNGASYAGRLGGWGSHGPTPWPQGDVLAFWKVLHRLPTMADMLRMEQAFMRRAPNALEDAKRIAGWDWTGFSPPTIEEVERPIRGALGDARTTALLASGVPELAALVAEIASLVAGELAQLSTYKDGLRLDGADGEAERHKMGWELPA